MFKFLRKHRTTVLVTLALVAVALPFFQIGTSSLMSSTQDVVAKVNGQKITIGEFDRLYNQILRQKPELKPEERQRLTNEAFNELIRQEVFAQEAKRYGIYVTDQELQLQLGAIPAFQKEGRFDVGTYLQVLSQAIGTTPQEFEKSRKKDLAAGRLNQLIAHSVHVTDDVLAPALEARLKIETDKEKIKKLREDPEELRKELEGKEINAVFRDWLSQMNAGLKIQVTSESFRKRLAGAQ